MAPPSDSLAQHCSPFLDELIRRHPDWWAQLEAEGRLENDAGPSAERLHAWVRETGLDPALRQFRNQEMMRIVWRDLERIASLDQTLEDLTCLAEHCLREAHVHHAGALSERYGTPRCADGEKQGLVVVGMGKLGGRELNLSSDIDVIFCYPKSGECDGPRNLSNERYFTRLARAIVRSLADITEHGFCFRVDTRLRPFGDSGPLVCSFGAMEQYYQREGRDWERYALVKARPVAGDLAQGDALLSMLRPFVYRRYIDFGAIEALRDMHDTVRKDAARRRREHDIKRGAGGIREIEFIVQSHQLLRGGREPSLQTPSLREAIDALTELGLVDQDMAKTLREAYEFLRRLENAIQALRDEQTHDLPQNEDLERVARAMRQASAQALRAQVEEVRRTVHALFNRHVQGAESATAPSEWERRWRRLLDPAGGEEAGSPWPKFRDRLARQSLSQRASARLDRFMPLLLQRLADREGTTAALGDVLELVLAVTRRSAYLALLVQNPRALERMLDLFEESDWIAATVIRHPALLDELIDPRLGRMLPDRAELKSRVQRILGAHETAEEVLQALNHLKQAVSLRVAVAELETTLSAREVQGTLSDLAESLLAGCYRLAEGASAGRLEDGAEPALCIVGYGSLGARELGYRSDLDLIFLYDSGDDANSERPHTRLARKLISLLTVPTASGKLYATDTRLRPNGRAGLLVSSIGAFERYQLEHAWTWELQALTRARALDGGGDLGRRFSDIRRAVLTRPRDPGEVRREVIAMRRRLRAEFAGKDPLKHGAGGLVDMDFIAQLGVLESAPRHPMVLDSTSTTGQLRRLAEVGWIDPELAKQLVGQHERLARARHLAFIARDGGPAAELKRGRRLCADVLGRDAGNWFTLGDDPLQAS